MLLHFQAACVGICTVFIMILLQKSVCRLVWFLFHLISHSFKSTHTHTEREQTTTRKILTNIKKPKQAEQHPGLV